MSTALTAVADRAKREPTTKFSVLAHHLDEAALTRAFDRIRKDAAVGVDGVTKEQYGAELASNIQGLHGRMKTGRYRHQPIRRVHIPKDNGKTRPIGISAMEDKVVQGALTEMLEALYEPLFYEGSYGFRRQRSAHDALRALDAMVMQERMEWILEADIQAFFDSVVRSMLVEMLQERIGDKSFIRLVGKCLHVGVLDGEEYSEPGMGTAQGSIISPMLGNIYMHHVLDKWFHEEVLKRLQGRARLIRYADDFVIGFSRKEDAVRVLDVLHKRMARFGLTLHPDKTRLIEFRRPPPSQVGGKGPGTFDFLGFTVLWKRSRRGKWILGMQTRKARLGKALKAIGKWCRRHRHDPVKDQHAALSRRLAGHYNYFGINGNVKALDRFLHEVQRLWRQWLNRRSQQRSLTWEKFGEVLKRFPLPLPSIKVQIWGSL